MARRSIRGIEAGPDLRGARPRRPRPGASRRNRTRAPSHHPDSRARSSPPLPRRSRSADRRTCIRQGGSCGPGVLAAPAGAAVPGRGQGRESPRFAVLVEGCPEQEHICDEERTQDQAEKLGGVVPVPVPNTARHPGEPSVQLGCSAHEGSLQSVRATDAIRREEAASAEEPAIASKSASAARPSTAKPVCARLVITLPPTSPNSPSP